MTSNHRLTPTILAGLIGAEWADRNSAGLPFTRISIDSRDITGGELFVALPGRRTDGNRFVADAFDRGAAAALVSRSAAGTRHEDLHHLLVVADPLKSLQVAAMEWRRQFNIPVIGITGSVGKTTTKELMAQVVGSQRTVLRSVSSFNNEIGLPLTLLELAGHHQVVIVEMGMSAIGELRELCRIARPTHGVVTRVGDSHLEFLGTREAIAAAKQELIEELPAVGLAMLNADDPLVVKMAASSKAPVATFGMADGADLRISDVDDKGFAGIRFKVHWEDKECSMSTRIAGRHHLTGIGASLTAGLDFGMELEELAAAVAELHLDIRQRIVDGRDGVTIIDDSYNASPTSMLAALDLLGRARGRKVAILGDMLELGRAEESGHREVGMRAAAVADVVITVGPRAAIIAKAAKNGGGTDLAHAASTEDAIALAAKTVESGDIVLVKGSRAMTMERIVEALT